MEEMSINDIHLTKDRLDKVFETSELGSIIVIIGTDAPVMPHQ